VIARKGFFGWCADFGANLLVNIATILFIGLLALGASKTDWFNHFFENAVKPDTSASVLRPSAMALSGNGITSGVAHSSTPVTAVPGVLSDRR
jgi:hypothetical protein